MNKFSEKSSVAEIAARFDQDVERFSNLDTGQQTTLDAPFSLELITDSIAALHPQLRSVLDIGCGAGNYTLKLLSKINPIDCTLLDVSKPMLDRARQRVAEATDAAVHTVYADIRDADFADEQFDTIMAAAVFHHLRDDDDWELVFSKLYRILKPGGSVWISDLVTQESAPIQKLIYDGHYGQYLTNLKDEAYKRDVFAYIEKEDSPRSLNFQMRLLEKVGFSRVEVLHKNLCFAAFGAVK